MKRKNIFKSLLAAAMALIMIFGAAPLSGFVGIRLPMLSLKAEAATTEDGLFEYEVERRPWTEPGYKCEVRITRYKGPDSGEVVVPKTIEGYEVKWIGGRAFQNCTGITSVVIPAGVISIGGYAFSYCTSLAEITIPDSVTSIGEWAFSGCTSLTEIVIPDSVTSIGRFAFSGCTSLSKVDLPKNLTGIYSDVFSGCTSLAEITIPDSVTSIGESAFSGCTSLSKVKLSNNLRIIQERTFSGCTSLKEITIPDSVTEIGEVAFSGCTSLLKVVLSKNMTAIEAQTFSGCSSLESIIIPEGVTKIGTRSKSEDSMFDGAAFYGCTSLKEIIIPDSVTEIWSSAFSGCTSLSKVDLPKNLTKIEGDTFFGCTSLAEITIPDSVTSIGGSAFKGCTSLSKVDLPKMLTTIEAGTFRGCTSLKEIIIPDSVIKILDHAFSNCTSLESITIGSGVESLGDEWIASCRRLENITVSPENKTYSSVDGVLFNKDKSELSAYPIGNKRSSYTIPDGVEKIGKKAFYGCRYIESLTIPVSVAEIEASALGNCYDIRAVYYLGTREQWKEVVIGADNYMFALVNVRCADDSQCRHVWGEWEVVEEATYEKDGLERRVCSLCKAEQTRKIPRLGAVKVDAIELSESEKKLNVGKSFTITATVKPDNAWNRTITWSSSDPSIATVDENGTVTAIAEGEAIITAESADGVKAECKVTVEKKESFGKKLLNVITAPFRAIINLFKKLFGK